MKRLKIKKSPADIVSQSGLALIGYAINRYTTLTQELDTQVPVRHGIKHSDMVKSYLGLVSAGKNDFEAINAIDSDRRATVLSLNCEKANSITKKTRQHSWHGSLIPPARLPINRCYYGSMAAMAPSKILMRYWSSTTSTRSRRLLTLLLNGIHAGKIKSSG